MKIQNKIENAFVGDFKLCFMNLMQSLKVKKVVFEYNGGGDSGGVESFYYVDSKGKKIDQHAVDSKITDIIQSIEEQLTDPVYDYHGSFAGEYNVSGELVYDCKAKKVYIEGTEYTYEYHYDNEDNDSEEGEEEEHSEGYEHDIPLKEEKEFHTQLAEIYAEHIGPLPEELHNKMLWHATEGDEYAKNYLKNFKNA